MPGITNLSELLQHMQPVLNNGEYVFCTVDDINRVELKHIVALFKEAEAITLIMPKHVADELQLPYTYVAAWISLHVHSSLEATGLTAAFASALANAGISCNVVAAYYHDHIFVAHNDAARALDVLKKLSASHQ